MNSKGVDAKLNYEMDFLNTNKDIIRVHRDKDKQRF